MKYLDLFRRKEKLSPENMIEEIREWLLASEQKMFSDGWTEQRTSELESIFNTYVDNGKLCDVDLVRVFEDDASLTTNSRYP